MDWYEAGNFVVGGITLGAVIWLNRRSEANADRRAEAARRERLAEQASERDSLLRQYLTVGDKALQNIDGQFRDWERPQVGPDWQGQVTSGMVSMSLVRLRREIEPLGYGHGLDTEARLAIGRLLDATSNAQQWTGLRGPRVWLAASQETRSEIDQSLAILRSKLLHEEAD